MWQKLSAQALSAWMAVRLRQCELERQGDIVLSFNEGTQTVEPKRVTQTFVRQTDRIYRVRYTTGEEFETTFNHEFFVKNVGWVQAKQLRPGDRSITANDSVRTIASVTGEARYETVYNFEVEDNHTYFVGRDGVLVHNQTAGEAYSNAVRQHNAVNQYACLAAAAGWGTIGYYNCTTLLPAVSAAHVHLRLDALFADAAKEDFPDSEISAERRARLIDSVGGTPDFVSTLGQVTGEHAENLARLSPAFLQAIIAQDGEEANRILANYEQGGRLIDEAAANRLRQTLEGFGTGPEADLKRAAYIHNTMVKGAANFQLSVELAAIVLPYCVGKATSALVRGVLQNAARSEPLLARAAAETLERSTVRAANVEIASSSPEVTAANRALTQQLERARPPVASGSPQPSSQTRPAGASTPLRLPITRTVDGGVQVTVQPSRHAPELLQTVDAPPGWTMWGRGNWKQGELAEQITGGRGKLPWGHPVDRAQNRVATSVKSIDLNLPSYRSGMRAVQQIDEYIISIANFERSPMHPQIRRGVDFDSVALEIVVPRGSLSTAPAGREFMQTMIQRARARGVNLRFIEAP